MIVADTKFIVIGNLGRVSRDALDASGKRAFDSYAQALRGYHSSFDNLAATAFAEAARRLAEASRLLRELAGPIAVPVQAKACEPQSPRAAAFFHPGKVDARNLP